MEIDLELYRQEVVVSTKPRVRLSAIDIAPETPLRTIVFLHGFGGNALQWKYQLREFSVKNRVIALDLRGHGRADKPAGDYAMPEVQADLAEAAKNLGVTGKFVLAGHSFGGAVAAEFASRHPDQVERLILIASAGEFRLNLPTRLGLSLPLAVLRLLAPFTRAWLHAPFHVLKPFYRNNLSQWNGWSLMRDIIVPTLVIRGNRDIVVEKPLFEEVARVIPAAEDVDVGSSGHMVMLERRDAVNRAIKRFLETSQHTWREAATEGEKTERAELLQARPWLQQYESGVPFTVAIPNVPVHQFLRSAERRFPQHSAVRFEGGQLTYRQLNEAANRFGHALRALGMQKGDRVMLLLPNIPQMVTGYFGALKAGAVVVFTLPNTEAAEIARQVKDAGIKVLVTYTGNYGLAREVLAAVGQARGPLAHVVLANPGQYLPAFKRLAARFSPEKRAAFTLPGPLEPGMLEMGALLAGQSKAALEEKVSSGDLAVIQYTGGTTAEPKGVMLSHRNLVANTLQTRHWMPDAKERKERFLCVIPFSHIYGLTTALNVPVALGATLILKARFETENILQAIKHYKPTIFPGVPQMYVAISGFPGVRRFGISSIRACISGSAPLPVEVQEEFEKLTRGKLVEGYGLTEASPVTHANPLNGMRKVGSIGIPLPSTEACVLDLPTGKREVPPGQIGELAVRGPQVMLGYWNNPQATAEVVTPGGWLLTGDVAQMDSDGYFRIIARKADMWYPSKDDQPAFPRDVEEVLYEIPQVKEAAVVAIAGHPIAFVIPERDRPTAESLIAYCKRRLPPELVPRFVIFLDDFPRTFIGKVLRRELARRYEQLR